MLLQPYTFPLSQPPRKLTSDPFFEGGQLFEIIPLKATGIITQPLMKEFKDPLLMMSKPQLIFKSVIIYFLRNEKSLTPNYSTFDLI